MDCFNDDQQGSTTAKLMSMAGSPWLSCELEAFVAAENALLRAQGEQGKMLCLTPDATCFMPGKACPPDPSISG